MKSILLATLLIFPAMGQADDDPRQTLDSQKFDQSMCVQEVAGDCVNTMCLTSEERDCTDKCEADAEVKCGANQDGT